MDLISVIIPCYNVEQYVEKCVYSVINQTYKNIEIILVDDGSIDSTGKKCDELSEKDDRILVFHQTNGGLSAARNTGIVNSKGKYLMFVDSDDFVDNTICEFLYSTMQETNSKISICNRFTYYSNGKKYVRYMRNYKILKMTSEEAILEMNNFKYFDMSAWGKLYEKELFDNIMFPINKKSEDYFIMYKLFDKAQRICCSPEPKYYYLQRDNSITKSNNFNYDFIKAAHEQMLFVEAKYPNLKCAMHTAYASSNMTIFNDYIKRKIKCPKEQVKRFQLEVKKNIDYISKNNNLSITKKIQAILFVKSIKLYVFCFKLFKLMNKA